MQFPVINRLEISMLVVIQVKKNSNITLQPTYLYLKGKAILFVSKKLHRETLSTRTLEMIRFQDLSYDSWTVSHIPRAPSNSESIDALIKPKSFQASLYNWFISDTAWNVSQSEENSLTNAEPMAWGVRIEGFLTDPGLDFL